MTFDPGAVPPADDPLADPAEAELKERLEAARALLDEIGPPTAANLARFLEVDALEAAALLREHDRPGFWRLTEALRPHKILRQWQGAVGSVAKELAEVEQKIAEKVRIVALGVELLELWHDGAQGWCWPKEHGPACCWRMPGSEVRRYLLAAYGARNQTTLEAGQKVPMAPGRQAVGEALDQLEAIAHSGQRRGAPALRVAGDAARVVVDLCRDDYSVVEVTAAGWDLVKPSPIAVRRADGMLPLPLPVQGAGDALGDLRMLLRFDGEDHAAFWTLYVGFMFAALRPLPPYFVFVVDGEQGSGKTTTAKIVRVPVDPHETDIQPKPRTEDDLFVNADGQWLNAYDNLSTLDQHWSDAFCRISTGSGYSKRKLYSDRDTARFQVARPQIITSIVDVVAAPDLLDRSLLAPMPELEGFRAEEELLAAVAELSPRVLGQLLDAMVIAIRDQRSVELSTAPRMVGPTQWIEAGAKALGLEPGAFLKAYLDSQARAGEMALEASLVGMPLRDMLEERDALAALGEQIGEPYVGPRGFEGTAKKLLTDLNAYLVDHARTHARGRGWPLTPRGMSAALRRITPALRKLGYRIEFLTVGHAKERIITIDTALSYAARSAHNANDRPHRPHRPHDAMDDIIADGADSADGRKHTQTNGGHSTAEEPDAAERVGTCPHCRHPIYSDDVVRARNGAVLHHRCVDAWVRQQAPAGTAKPFEPGDDWQDLPDGVPLPRGCEIKRDRTTGRRLVRRQSATDADPRSPAAAPGANGSPDLGRRVRAARTAKGLSQGALAKMARTHQSTVSQLELGREVSAEVGARVRATLGIE